MDYKLLQVLLFGFMNKLVSPAENHRWERSSLIHGYGYESAGACTACPARLFVSSMRLSPSGLTRYFVPDKILPINSRSFMQYAA